MKMLTNPTMTSPTLTGPTIIATPIEEDFRLPALDLYRDIHKGIRCELFAVTTRAGNIDPSNTLDWAELAAHLGSVENVLSMHADHEDTAIGPVLAEFDAPLAEQIEADHHTIEQRFGRVIELSEAGSTIPSADQRTVAHLLYLELSVFTADYLRHQLIEERVVMPTLERHLGFDEILGIHLGIIGSIPPEGMAKSLAFMLPAMNVDDRTELLGGMRESAPPEAFAGVVSLARSVLEPADFNAVASRLGIH